jgi:hypothetical protein
MASPIMVALHRVKQWMVGRNLTLLVSRCGDWFLQEGLVEARLQPRYESFIKHMWNKNEF